MKIIKEILKAIAPKSFNDGLEKCNQLGKKLIKTRNLDNFLYIETIQQNMQNLMIGLKHTA